MADPPPIYRASTTAPVNIAVIKYWGKRNPTLNLPTNSSLSITLSQSDLRTHTTASCSPSYPSSTLTLNNTPHPLTTPRTVACLASLRALRTALESANPSLPKLSTHNLRLVSSNNFPTAAGLASSAAGFAALVRAVADLYQLPQSPEELSVIARQGSGSACRSLLGGYVAWDMGFREDGTDSRARVVASKEHWPEMRALILVASAATKDVSSTEGMQRTVQTSALFATRASTVVPEAMARMERAIGERDFETFAEVVMGESNSFHATCLDSKPPIFYLNHVSRAVISVVEAMNERVGRQVAAYTFDAGPNAVIYFLEADEGVVRSSFGKIFGKGKEGWVEKGGKEEALVERGGVELGEGLKGVEQVVREGVVRVIETGIGEGPVSVQEHLVDEKGEAVIVETSE